MRNERGLVQMERGRKEEFREERKRDLESGKEEELTDGECESEF